MVQALAEGGEAAAMKRLPIGIQSFKEIRSEPWYYVDKTRFVKAMAGSGKYFFLIEFKVVELEPQGHALEQIKGKRYWEAYGDKAHEVYLIGAEFSKRERNLVNFQWEKVE